MNILLQIGIVLGICLVGEAISSILPFILPGNIIGMIIIFILLLVRVMKIDHIRQKAQFLKQNMAFFLVPSSVSIIQHTAADHAQILHIVSGEGKGIALDTNQKVWAGFWYAIGIAVIYFAYGYIMFLLFHPHCGLRS